MLQDIRDRIQGIAARILIFAVIAVFALFGVESIINLRGERAPAEVNGEEISAEELQRTVALEVRRRAIEAGDDPDAVDEQAIQQRVLDQLILRTLLLQYSRDAGIAVPDQAVDRAILSQPDFQYDGQFDQQLFRNVLRSAGLTPTTYQRALGEDLALQQLASGVSASAFLTPAELDAAVRLLQEHRDLRILRFPVTSYLDDAQVPEQAALEYYEANTERFVTEEMVQVQYLVLDAESVRDRITVSDEAVREEYDARAAALADARRQRAAHILVSVDGDEADARQRAERLRARITAGEPFEEVARAESADIGSVRDGGDLGYSAGDLFPAPIENALDQLEVGEVSAPVRTEAGIHLVKLVDREAQSLPQFESMAADIRAELEGRAVERELALRAEALADAAYAAGSLEEPAAEFSLEIRTSGHFSRDSGEGIAADPQVRAQAFSSPVLRDGFNSEVIKQEGRYLVLRLAEHQPVEQRSFAEVKDDIVLRLKHERAGELASRAAELALAALQSGADWDAAQPKGALSSAHENIGRSVPEPGLDPALQAAAFAIPAPGEEGGVPRRVVIGSNGDPAVIEVVEVVPGDPGSLTSDQRNQLARLMARSMGQLDLGLVQAALEATADIDRN